MSRGANGRVGSLARAEQRAANTSGHYTAMTITANHCQISVRSYHKHFPGLSASLSNAGLAKTHLPVLVGDDAPFHLLVVLADANGQPGAQLAVVQGVHHTENLPLVEAQAVGRLLLVLKVRPDVERVANVGLHDPPIH